MAQYQWPFHAIIYGVLRREMLRAIIVYDEFINIENRIRRMTQIQFGKYFIIDD